MLSTSALLSTAIRHIARAETLIARQTAIISSLESMGRSTELAYELLETMYVSLDLMRDDKAQIERLSTIKAEF
jgi:hypothetical protein